MAFCCWRPEMTLHNVCRLVVVCRRHSGMAKSLYSFVELVGVCVCSLDATYIHGEQRCHIPLHTHTHTVTWKERQRQRQQRQWQHKTQTREKNSDEEDGEEQWKISDETLYLNNTRPRFVRLSGRVFRNTMWWRNFICCSFTHNW